MNMKSLCTFLFTLILSIPSFAQSLVEGYVYQDKNRGYINNVTVVLINESGEEIDSTSSNRDGFFDIVIPNFSKLSLVAKKESYETLTYDLTFAEKFKDKYFVKLEMKAAPGYNFEITLANPKRETALPVDAIEGALIEVYNNTTRKEAMVIHDFQKPEFNINLVKGNHYTILIRKEGYLAKRMEAYVDVEGCVLCFEGLGKLEPGVSDNLTDRNRAGSFLANLELEPLFTGKKIELENIYYDLGKWDIRPEAEESLNKISTFMRDNPRLKVELGSHTDSRGSAPSNMKLSINRAKSARNYLTSKGGVAYKRITYKGYGETEIINACKDGVVCEEHEHQDNRRTELKILGLEEEGEFKSLKRMKMEEFFDEDALELSEQEQVVVTEDAPLPDDLKAYIKAQEDKKKLEIKSEIQTNTEEVIEIEEEMTSMTKDSNVIQKISETENEIKEEVIDEVEDVKVQVTEVIDHSILEKDSRGEFPESQPSLNEFRKVENGKNVYRILLKISPDKLPDSHQIQKDFGEIMEFQWPERSYYYFVGEFDEVFKAKNFLDQYVKEKNPNAKVMYFKDGYPMAVK